MKNNLKAIEWRVEGNKNYKLSRFYDALVCYNRSLCNSTPASIEFALSLANRSAVYFAIKDFKLCLENIKLAIDNGYPEGKMKTLLDRREKCLQVPSITTCGSPWDFFKLSHPPNENLPFVSKCIELRVSKMFGRHLVTRKALKTGDIICIEEPFHKFINNECRFSHCANCLKSEKFNLIPCGGCNYGNGSLLGSIYILSHTSACNEGGGGGVWRNRRMLAYQPHKKTYWNTFSDVLLRNLHDHCQSLP